MISAIRAGATGMQSQQGLLDTTANNLANVNTTSFKRNQVDFVDQLYLSRRAAGAQVAEGVQSPTGSQIGTGVAIASTAKDFRVGPINFTERELDLAIEGEGFFRVALPNGGLRYTRDGNFQLDSTGRLTTTDGLLVQPPLTIPANATSVNIGRDGSVFALLSGQTNPQLLGQITVANFPNPEGLASEGRNLYAETGASGRPVVGAAGANGTGPIRQGFLEGSNVETVREITNLILAQQAFTFNAESIRVSNEMLRSTTDLIR